MSYAELKNVTLTYGAHTAVQDLSLQVGPGEVVGLIGPNGAGKTSVLKLFAGLAAPTSGEVRWPRGWDNSKTRARHIGYLPQHPSCSWNMRVEEIVRLGRMHHRSDEDAVSSALARMGIGALKDRPYFALSGGEQRRALLARVLAGEPELLILDEPDTALDPAHQLSLMQMLKEFGASDRAVIVSLHDLIFAARCCTRLVLMKGGQVLAQDSPQAILSRGEIDQLFDIEGKVAEIEQETLVIPWGLPSLR